MPTRDDVLALRSVDEAFDLWTRRPTRREVGLIRVAETEGLVYLTDHAYDACDDEEIDDHEVHQAIVAGRAHSKDTDGREGRQIGVNFQGRSQSRRSCVRANVGWDDGYFIATVHRV